MSVSGEMGEQLLDLLECEVAYGAKEEDGRIERLYKSCDVVQLLLQLGTGPIEALADTPRFAQLEIGVQ